MRVFAKRYSIPFWIDRAISAGGGNFVPFLPLNWLPWQHPLRYRKKKDVFFICNSIPTTYGAKIVKICPADREIIRLPANKSATTQNWLPWQRPLRNRKNWTWSRKFTQIPSIWWKDRENRSNRHWDSFAHNKKRRNYASLPSGLNCGLWYVSSHNTQCVGFSDADFTGDTDDWKSTTGYMFKLSGAAIS